jgi:hypothetical protein
MTVALAQPRAGLKAESAQAEPAAVAVQMRTIPMFVENASRGVALVVIRHGTLHDRHCTAVAEASAMASRAVHQGGPGSLLRVTGAVPGHLALALPGLPLAGDRRNTPLYVGQNNEQAGTA